MTIQECYQEMGGDFAQMEKRLPNERLISKLVVKFLDDGSFADLCSAMEAGQREAAFRAAHTLKGVCGNLSFAKLLASVTPLTELLRPEMEIIPEEAFSLMEEVKRDYEQTAGRIRAYMNAME